LAIANFNRALKIDPNNALSYMARGGCYADQGKYQLARTDLEKAKQLFLNQNDTIMAEKVDGILKLLLNNLTKFG
jgi:Flp pilus assembly protein TadD